MMRRRTSRLLVLGMATMIAANIWTPVASAQDAAAPSITWGECPQDILDLGYNHVTCANLQVPLDYTRPDGPKASIFLTKAAAKDPAKRRGALLVNNGGPGAPAAEFTARITKANGAGVTRLPARVLEAYDVIGMDPRGVAHSTPAVECVDPNHWAGPMPDPDNRGQHPALRKKFDDFIAGCVRKSGDLLPYVGTTDVARDIDQVRLGLGLPKISYLGFSYGSYLGAVYATMFPKSLDRLLLDGNLDPGPRDFYYQTNLKQNVAIFKRRDEWFRWIASYDKVFHLGTDGQQVRRAWESTLAQLREAPRGQVGPWEFIDTTFGVMYSESSWIALASALSDFVVKGDDTALVDFATPVPSRAVENSLAAYQAVDCLEADWPITLKMETDAAHYQVLYPFAAWRNMWGNWACGKWPLHAPRFEVNGAGLAPFLMLNNLGDPATPYSGAEGLRKRMPSAVLVSVQANKHCEFANPLSQANARVNQIGADYLVDGTLPSGDITVPGHPLPVPAALSAARADSEDFLR
jgi:pimeloyl-ACP methyl ester carboxylesterase